MKIFSRFDVPPSCGISCGDGLTQQHFKDECDINNILRNYVPPVNNVPPPVFGDFTTSDLMTAYDIVRSASSNFDALDSNIRARFNNNPVELMQFLENEKNREEAIQLGLLVAPQHVVNNPVDNSVSVSPEPAEG